MSVQLEEATDRLRQMLLDGSFPPGKKLREVSVAESLGVSRTIARLSMSALEHEGLLTRELNRGSRTRAFDVEEIIDAIEVRGELEAMAARLAAERGVTPEYRDRLQQAVAEAEDLLAGRIETEEQRTAWVAMNTRFHEALVAASGNRSIAVAIRQMMALPLVSPASIIFERNDPALGHMQLLSSHGDHVAVLDAITAHQGHRAEALVREHAFRSAQNKRRNLSDPAALDHARSLPGGKLIVAGDTAYPRRSKRRLASAGPDA